MAFLKKATTTELNRSRKAGYLLNVCYGTMSTELMQVHSYSQSLITVAQGFESIRRKLVGNTLGMGLRAA